MNSSKVYMRDELELKEATADHIECVLWRIEWYSRWCWAPYYWLLQNTPCLPSLAGVSRTYFLEHEQYLLEYQRFREREEASEAIFSRPSVQNAVKEKWQERKGQSAFNYLVFYMLYLLVVWRVGVINSGDLSLDGFSQNEGFGEAILREPFDDAEAPNLAYNDITKPEEWWGWARGSLFDALYSETTSWSSGGEDFELGEGNFINGYGLIMTPIRMTQWRSEAMQCTKLDERIAESAGVDRCFKGYSDVWLFGYVDFDGDSAMKDRSSFGPNQEFEYSHKGVGSSSTYLRRFAGRFGVYGDGGFVEILSPNATVANATLDHLQRSNWVDGATRAILVEFGINHVNSGRLTDLAFLVEFPAQGGLAQPQHAIHTYNGHGNRLPLRGDDMDNVQGWCFEVAYVVLVSILFNLHLLRKVFYRVNSFKYQLSKVSR